MTKRANDPYPHLPEYCRHGSNDPHTCLICRRIAKQRADQAAHELEAIRTTADLHAPPADDLDMFKVFLQQHYPALDPQRRAIAFAHDKPAHQLWKDTCNATCPAL